MHTIENGDLSGKTILEVGSGRGDTTRALVALLEGKSGTQLIVTDISDRFFEEFQNRDIQLRFLQTGAHELKGVLDSSIDFLVCNYTLCAVNSQAGLVSLALKRFHDVLKPGGKLLIEEEFPISKQDTPRQAVWAEKWRILKSAMILAGYFPFNEMEPDLLESLCCLAGFENVEWTQHTEIHQGVEALDFFQKRTDALFKELPVENIRNGFAEMAANVREKARQVGGMEIPFYRLVAQKSE